MNKNEPKYYASPDEWQKYLQKFSTKKISKEFAKQVKLKREKLANPPIKDFQKIRRQEIRITDDSLALDAKIAARNSNGRIQNWTSARPSTFHTTKGDYDTNDEGKYSRSCKYTKYSYSPIYTSYVILAMGGSGLLYRRGFKGEIKSKIIHAPKGMCFSRDDNGLVLKRVSDGMDYHPTANDLQSKKFATTIRKEMAKNFLYRLNQKRLEKQNKRNEKIFQRDLKTTMVTLHDSRKAGNCIEGSLQFAEKRLNIPREEILNGGFIFKINAQRLIKTGDERAMRAVKVAWNRETIICI